MRRRIIGFSSLVALAAVMALYIAAPTIHVLAQGSAGFSKIASATTTTYTDSTVTAGSTYEYEVTGTDAAGESTPGSIAPSPGANCTMISTTIVGCAIPTTGSSHQVALSWTAGANDTSFNVYRFLVPLPSPPTAVGATAN